MTQAPYDHQSRQKPGVSRVNVLAHRVNKPKNYYGRVTQGLAHRKRKSKTEYTKSYITSLWENRNDIKYKRALNRRPIVLSILSILLTKKKHKRRRQGVNISFRGQHKYIKVTVNNCIIGQCDTRVFIG